MTETKRVKMAKRRKQITKSRNMWNQSKVKRFDGMSFDQRKVCGQFKD